MKLGIHTIFYSWQSDLPEIDNKSFIGNCLSKALSKFQKEMKMSLEYIVDRATSNKIGTIDIAQTIFNKINNAKLFVADVSIINPQSRKYRKTPNPNILVELGYAVRTIGWENIICVFNTKYGRPEDLPFDIRNRRLLLYNSNEDKSFLINDLCNIIKDSRNIQVPSDIIRDYYNSKIYTSLFHLVSDCHKFFFGYEIGTTTKGMSQVLNLEEKDIVQKIDNQSFIGFQLFKIYSEVIKNLEIHLEKILIIRQFNDNYYVPLVKIINALKLYDKFLNRKMKIERLESVSTDGQNNYAIFRNSADTSLLHRFILLRKIKQSNNLGVVIDFGDFDRGDFQKELLNSFKITENYVGFLCWILHHYYKCYK